MEELKRKAQAIEPKITGWDHEGNPNFLYAQYRVDNFGNVVGIRLSDNEIIFAVDQPIVVDDGVIIQGHGRLKAAKQLKIPLKPCYFRLASK